MTAFLALVRKDLILYIADRRALLMHLVLPIVIAAFFGSVFGGGSAKGGGIDLTRLTLFLGPASISASGPLTLSSAGLLSGTLNVRLVGLDQLPDIAEGIRQGSRDRVAQIVAAISAFTKPVKTEEGEARETVLTVVNGTVMVGLIPVGKIPPLKL